MTDVYNQTDLEMLAADCLTRAGVGGTVARIVARDVALSEAAGNSDHGVAGLLRDIRLLRYGRLYGDAEVVISTPAPSVVAIDAGHGFAAAALAQGMPALVEATNSQGIAMVHLTRASDPGLMAGTLADLAVAGLAGVVVRSGGETAAIRPGSDQPIPLDTGARSMLSDLLALAPPAADTPLGGPVALNGWLCAVDPDVTGMAALFADLPNESLTQRRAGITVAPELLAQIVNA